MDKTHLRTIFDSGIPLRIYTGSVKSVRQALAHRLRQKVCKLCPRNWESPTVRSALPAISRAVRPLSY